jgi:hypothetical protein
MILTITILPFTQNDQLPTSSSSSSSRILLFSFPFDQNQATNTQMYQMLNGFSRLQKYFISISQKRFLFSDKKGKYRIPTDFLAIKITKDKLVFGDNL